MDKAKGVSDFCRTLKPDDIVCFVDGFDSVILDRSKIEERYLELGHPLVFSAECSDEVPFCRYFEDKMKWRCKSTKVPLNSGLYIGRSDTICSFWEDFINRPDEYTNDDQTFAVSKCDQVKIDTDYKIFLNYYSIFHKVKVQDGKVIYKNSTIPVMSGPGGSNMNEILKELGNFKNIPDDPSVNNIKNHVSKFTTEIIVAVFCVLLFLVLDKKYAVPISALSIAEMMNFEVNTNHKKKINKILYTLGDILYLFLILGIVPWLIIQKKFILGNILFMSLLFLPFVNIDTRVRYFFGKHASYEDNKGNVLMICFVLLLNLYTIYRTHVH
jgi:hypothetical protein